MKNLDFQIMRGVVMSILLVLVTLTFPVSAQAEILDDFNDGDAIGWTEFSLPPGLIGAEWDPSDGVYRLYVGGEKARTPAGAVVASFLDITNDAPEWSFTNGFWSATAVRENENSTTHLFMRGEFLVANAYAFGWLPDKGLSIQRFEGGYGTLLANDPEIVQEVGTAYIFEAGAFGNGLELRMWPVGEPRPVNPQVTATDSYYATGANGIASQAFTEGSLSGTFDDVSFTTGTTTVPGSSFEDTSGLVAFPNPSPGRVLLRVRGAIDDPHPAEISIYDVRGKLVYSSGRQSLGSEFEWNGKTQTGQPAPSGVYLAVVRNATRTHRGTIHLVR